MLIELALVGLGVYGLMEMVTRRWKEVAELRYGTAKRLDQLSLKMDELEDRLGKISPESIKKMQDDVSALKVRLIAR
jgi:hypothetical protein